MKKHRTRLKYTLIISAIFFLTIICLSGIAQKKPRQMIPKINEESRGKMIPKLNGESRKNVSNQYRKKNHIYLKKQEAASATEQNETPPENLKTPTSSLPMESKVDRQTVSINSYPSPIEYTVFNQCGKINKNSGRNTVVKNYMPGHGCAACCTATVLNAFLGKNLSPVNVTETIEREVFGESVWQKNYTRPYNRQCPISLYGISRILSYYKINNHYIRCFPGAEQYGDIAATAKAAEEEITRHLKTGNPVIIEVSQRNWKTGENDRRWSNSVHTMVLLGITDEGKAIVADPANRSHFGRTQRIKYATVKHMTHYMFSCTDRTDTNVYWPGKAGGGGYILVNPYE